MASYDGTEIQIINLTNDLFKLLSLMYYSFRTLLTELE